MKPSYRFVGTPLYLTDQEAYRLHKYLKRGRAAGQVVSFERFDFDLPALLTPVLLDCARCHLAHDKSCCEGGFPFPPDEALLPVLDGEIGQIAERYLAPALQDHLLQKGLYERHVETAGHPTIGTFDGNCLFCLQEGEGPACAAHRHALAQGRAPHDIKPLSCLLYPLDLIEVADGRVLVTALTAQTARFSRWGEDYRLDYVCANRELRQEVAQGKGKWCRSENIVSPLPDDVFPLEQYRPAYEEGRGSLVHLFGEEVYQRLQEEILEWQRKETDMR